MLLTLLPELLFSLGSGSNLTCPKGDLPHFWISLIPVFCPVSSLLLSSLVISGTQYAFIASLDHVQLQKNRKDKDEAYPVRNQICLILCIVPLSGRKSSIFPIPKRMHGRESMSFGIGRAGIEAGSITSHPWVPFYRLEMKTPLYYVIFYSVK